ncbi:MULTISPECIES: hypothetical protein [Myxococcaceae]|nr:MULTISPECIES: hypothetical protein [Myxococcaceae]MBF5042189.1 hypothetical protein [Simulacricoccus sp. 17bor-14]
MDLLLLLLLADFRPALAPATRPLPRAANDDAEPAPPPPSAHPLRPAP